MKVLGMIVEYNPFHNGHKYHLQEALRITEAECSVAVMSGNFLQRGEPALWDKRIRSRIAVENGVDLVIELPFAFACNNAEQFARGGVALLSALGCVTDLVFGCEGEFSAIERTAAQLAHEDAAFKKALSAALESGLSFPAARTKALALCGNQEGAELLTEPNNILAAEYVKQCLLQKSSMKPMGIRRQGQGYHSEALLGEMASAKAIRAEWLKTQSLTGVQSFLPKETADVLKEINIEDNLIFNDFFPMLAAKLRSASAKELQEIYAVSEGMENLFKKAVLYASNGDELLAQVKSKRYTQTRLQRALMQCLIGFTRQDYEKICREELLYAHVLAFNEKGARLLKQIKKTECSSIPICSNLSKDIRPDDSRQILLQYDILANDLYHLGARKQIYANSDLVFAPYYKKGWIF